jgi:cytochrome c oxidase subunit I+III
MPSERLGRAAFWLMFAGFNLTFFPMHQLGLDGMTRRIYTYLPGLGWEALNLTATIGAGFMAAAVLTITFNAVRSLRAGAPAPANPWNASTLEWSAASPPAPYNFHPETTVGSRDPLWDDSPDLPVITGVRSDRKEVLVTRLLDAAPDHRYHSPEPSVWPFWAALATTAMFIGSIFTPWAVVWGSLPVAITLIKWFWPTDETVNHETHPPEHGRPQLDAASGHA